LIADPSGYQEQNRPARLLFVDNLLTDLEILRGIRNKHSGHQERFHRVIRNKSTGYQEQGCLLTICFPEFLTTS